METFMRALLIAGLTAISALAQCSAPEFFGSSEILAIGERAFSVVNGGNGGCSTGGLSGNVWLVRPGDSSFQAIQMGYFDATNGTSPNNTIKAPSVSSPGYGYRIIIASDPSSTPIAASPTFSLVTNDWYTQSYNHLALVYPSPQSDSSSWSSSGDQLIAYQAFEDFGQNTFTVLLYNAEDATQAPTTVASSVPIPSLDQTTDEYYFTIENTLPTGSKYQLVLVPSADATDKVLSMSGLIQIASGSGSPGSFPYTYTQVRTIGGGSVTVTQASTTSLPSSDGASTSASSMLPVENPREQLYDRLQHWLYLQHQHFFRVVSSIRIIINIELHDFCEQYHLDLGWRGSQPVEARSHKQAVQRIRRLLPKWHMQATLSY
ncbi:hypothetical protein CALCODRAFT_509047 [Calocera cornea HHB12733]|uniref:Uncharacterized protein n=1 Tax=Calocera cornea HHB12733 TaxID=1353952 RepID=A0A165FR19_9BASI|nr:hypothetical protein CALCODRAFT_509047 [Calocera cornea HHB12733]